MDFDSVSSSLLTEMQEIIHWIGQLNLLSDKNSHKGDYR